jgi:hypothetical protein
MNTIELVGVIAIFLPSQTPFDFLRIKEFYSKINVNTLGRSGGLSF